MSHAMKYRADMHGSETHSRPPLPPSRAPFSEHNTAGIHKQQAVQIAMPKAMQILANPNQHANKTCAYLQRQQLDGTDAGMQVMHL